MNRLRDTVAEVSRRLHARGWVANHDGNVSARESAGRFLCTPTATSKAVIEAGDVIVVNERGEKVAGAAKPFGEIGLHMTIYARRADAAAVVHAHPPCATAIACSGSRLLERPFIAEAVVSLGATIPTVPFAPPGAAACAALAPFVAAHDAVLLANHGVIAWGDDADQAYLRVELVEHLARIALEAEKAGGVRPLPDDALPALLEARKKAFPRLAAAALVASASTKVVACGPAPPGSDVEVIAPGRSSKAAPPADLVTVIREELLRAIKES
jgi:L-fuculose-phosphate aldolase